MDVRDYYRYFLFLNASFRVKPGLKMDLELVRDYGGKSLTYDCSDSRIALGVTSCSTFAISGVVFAAYMD